MLHVFVEQLQIIHMSMSLLFEFQIRLFEFQIWNIWGSVMSCSQD